MPPKVTWVVGLDGSALSFRCLRLAAMTMKLDGSHNLLALSLVGPGEEPKKSMMSKAEEEARRAGIFTLSIHAADSNQPALQRTRYAARPGEVTVG